MQTEKDPGPNEVLFHDHANGVLLIPSRYPRVAYEEESAANENIDTSVTPEEYELWKELTDEYADRYLEEEGMRYPVLLAWALRLDAKGSEGNNFEQVRFRQGMCMAVFLHQGKMPCLESLPLRKLDEVETGLIRDWVAVSENMLSDQNEPHDVVKRMLNQCTDDWRPTERVEWLRGYVTTHVLLEHAAATFADQAPCRLRDLTSMVAAEDSDFAA